MSDPLTRSDWFYKEPKTLSDAGITPDEETPMTPALKVKQSGREYYEAAKDSEFIQKTLRRYFNRTHNIFDIRATLNEFIQDEYPERYPPVREANEEFTPPPYKYRCGVGFTAKALAEDGIIDVKLHQSPPKDRHPSTEINGVPHWECRHCDFVARNISDNQITHPYLDIVDCPVCDRQMS